MRHSWRRIALPWVITACLALCGAARADDPPWPGQAWTVSAPDAEGMDADALVRLVDFGAAVQMDSVLVVRHGRLVLDATYAPFGPGMPHALNSATKSITGALVAVAIDKGLLEGTNQRVMDLFPDRRIGALDDRKRAVTLQSLLDMTSGIDWTEPLDGAPQTLLQMRRSGDWVQFILDRPMARAPGEDFAYNTGNSHLLSAILGQRTGRSARDFAQQQLFDPLGIVDVRWRSDPQGVSWGGGGLYLRPHDMARIGYLFLRRGAWNGRRIVPERWIDEITGAHVEMGPPLSPMRYANAWWVAPRQRAYMAVGYNRQLIVVLPALDMVVVATGRTHYSFGRFLALLAEAVKGDEAMPPDPAARDRLAARVAQAATETATSPPSVAAGPVARAVSGKTFRFGANPLGLQSITLDFTGAEPAYEIVGNSPIAGAQRARGTIGMDGRFRLNATPGGIDAVKAAWTAPDVLSVHWRWLLDGNSADYRLRFADDRVELHVEDRSGLRLDLQGRAD